MKGFYIFFLIVPILSIIVSLKTSLESNDSLFGLAIKSKSYLSFKIIEGDIFKEENIKYDELISDIYIILNNVVGIDIRSNKDKDFEIKEKDGTYNDDRYNRAIEKAKEYYSEDVNFIEFSKKIDEESLSLEYELLKGIREKENNYNDDTSLEEMKMLSKINKHKRKISDEENKKAIEDDIEKHVQSIKDEYTSLKSQRRIKLLLIICNQGFIYTVLAFFYILLAIERNTRKKEYVLLTVNEVNNNNTNTVEPLTKQDDSYLCSKCNVSMQIRTVTSGEHKGKQFYVCSNYPNCREMKEV